MASKVTELRGRATEIAHHPRTRKVAIWLVAIVVAFGILAGLVAPPLLRGKLASELSTKLHRQVSIEQIRINPFAMSVTVRGFLDEGTPGIRDCGSPLTNSTQTWNFNPYFAGHLFLKKSAWSNPTSTVVRNEDHTYNFTDLIDEFTKGPPEPKGPPAPTPRFALNNIQLLDGKIDFDDRPEQTKHAITSIKIGVPFISSIPSQVEIKVQPAFYALVNGAPFQIDGEAKPFKDSRESTIHLDIDKLQIPKYVEYSPVELNFKVPSGQLNTKLTVAFRTIKDKPSVLSISGDVGIKELLLQEKTDAPLLNLPAFDVVIDDVEVFAKQATLKSVKLQVAGAACDPQPRRDREPDLADSREQNRKGAGTENQ